MTRLVVRNGALVSWLRVNAATNPAAALVVDEAALASMLGGSERAGIAAVRPLATSPRTVELPPADLTDSAAVDLLQKLKRSSLDLTVSFTSGLWATQSSRVQWRDGRLVPLAEDRAPDLRLVVRYRSYLDFREGRIGLYELFDEGLTIDGEVADMQLALGLHLAPGMVEATRSACSGIAEPLGRFADFLDGRGVRATLCVDAS